MKARCIVQIHSGGKDKGFVFKPAFFLNRSLNNFYSYKALHLLYTGINGGCFINEMQ